LQRERRSDESRRSAADYRQADQQTVDGGARDALACGTPAADVAYIWYAT